MSAKIQQQYNKINFQLSTVTSCRTTHNPAQNVHLQTHSSKF